MGIYKINMIVYSLLEKVTRMAREQGKLDNPEELDLDMAYYHLPAGQHISRRRRRVVDVAPGEFHIGNMLQIFHQVCVN